MKTDFTNLSDTSIRYVITVLPSRYQAISTEVSAYRYINTYLVTGVRDRGSFALAFAAVRTQGQ